MRTPTAPPPTLIREGSGVRVVGCPDVKRSSPDTPPPAPPTPHPTSPAQRPRAAGANRNPTAGQPTTYDDAPRSGNAPQAQTETPTAGTPETYDDAPRSGRPSQARSEPSAAEFPVAGGESGRAVVGERAVEPESGDSAVGEDVQLDVGHGRRVVQEEAVDGVGLEPGAGQ
ncbi:hypothetical protein SALB_07150 [Streptomyces noursei]|uniref:Uncharacterized protein n=1 Tax=Streptomyces noursei TaxID=1971 RepID=A0A401R9N4_STRNR|nr:hypothetical protein SALB_07150 [Streptomyces noursei]